ncbi:hypothetical protein [Flavobacterium hungaricum]|nr:hypothetical protein [Flavobacterium hungaricum]
MQDEQGLAMYDYRARNYDPALGRLMNIAQRFNQMADSFYDKTSDVSL